ncbi:MULTISPECIES: hypothetical protein [unclassified Vibrio]|uniref:Uncharacterized protein n=1 Tax=Vibrio sp. HB236076 TaxID=3232307 RepID=A0AB39H830_9VIBR|nr:hypothetical protein [Vibrio sp. HB161653]MDP5253560.1 hypothetical protein [Vibrio sp. HB161653]
MFKKNIITLAIGVSASSLLVGCGSDSDSDSSSASTSTYSVKAIDGYLVDAQVWLDVNGDYQLSEGEPMAMSEAGGVANLDVSSVTDYLSYPILVKAIAGQTTDESEGEISQGFVMSAPPGEDSVTPLSTLVHMTMEKTDSSSMTDEEIEQLKASAISQVAAQLGLDSDEVLGDFIENQVDSAAYVAVNLVTAGVLPEDEAERETAADDDDFNNQLDAARTAIKQQVEAAGEQGFADLDNVFSDSDDFETDSDADGVVDVLDKFPDDATEWSDLDGDGTGDNSDTDIDGDGVENDQDAFPLNPVETIDTDDDGLGNNADSDDDGDGIADEQDGDPLDPTNPSLEEEEEEEVTDRDQDGYNDDVDDFPDDETEWLDSDLDGVGDNADAFPEDGSETLDTDSDQIGNNRDDDDDGDGLLDSVDPEPLAEDNSNSSDTAIAAAWLFSQSQAYIVYDDEDDSDQEVLVVEPASINGTDMTIEGYQTLIDTGVLSSLQSYESNDIILSANGWVLASVFPEIRYQDGEVVANNVDAPLQTYRLNGQLIALDGQNIKDTVEWAYHFDDELTFSEGSYVFNGLFVADKDTYYLDDNPAYVFAGDGGQSDGEVETLAQVISSVSAGDGASPGELVGVVLDYSLMVELVEGGIANYFTLDYTNNESSILASGTWQQQTISGEDLITAPIPDQVVESYPDRFDLANNIIVLSEYNGKVHEGTVDTAGESNDSVPIYNESAYLQIINNATTAVVTLCDLGEDVEAPTLDDFNEAVALCGGAESLPDADDLDGETFMRVRGDGETRHYTFNDMTLDVAKNGSYSYSLDWTIEGDYFKFTNADQSEVWYWALLNEDGDRFSFKFYEEYDDTSEIWSAIMTSDDNPVCRFDEQYDVSQSVFTQAIEAYDACSGDEVSLSDEDLDGVRLVRTNSDGEIRSFEFDSSTMTAHYYRNGVDRGEQNWYIEDERYIVTTALDDSLDVYNIMALLSDNDDSLIIANYTPEDSEIWVDTYYDLADVELDDCTISNTEFDDENNVPLTTVTFDTFLTTVSECQQEGNDIDAFFSDDYFNDDSRNLMLSDEYDTFVFRADGSGFLIVDEESIDMTWQLDETNHVIELNFVYTYQGEEYDVMDSMALVDTDGQSISVKVLSQTDLPGWPGVDSEEGDLWSAVFDVSYHFDE